MQQERLARAREGNRRRDIEESRALLLELCTSEPFIQQAFRVLECTCLAQGISLYVDGEDASEAFSLFVNEHYASFCKAAVRAIFAYGFVPWRVRTLPGGGDRVPEVLPPGTFTWCTESRDDRDRRDASSPDTLLVTYRATPCVGGLREEDIFVYTATPPPLNVHAHSVLYATVVSPLAHLLGDYKGLREAQMRRSHADAWNTTARIVSTFKPPMRGADDALGSALMDFAHDDAYSAPALGQAMLPPLAATNVWQRENVIRRQFESAPSKHHPEVFALPKDHDVVPQVHLEPCEDLTWLLDKFRRDVASLLGVPYEMLIGRDSTHETIRKTLASGRIFTTNINALCQHLKTLLKRAYATIYKVEEGSVEFFLSPMPRLEIESIADLKVLYEIGALTPDMSLNFSRLIVGDYPSTIRKRMLAKPGSNQQALLAAGGQQQQAPGASQQAFGSQKKGAQKEDKNEAADDPKNKRAKPNPSEKKQ